MKRYEFRLDKVLMLREFEEYKEKIILGKINEKIMIIKDELEKLNIGLGEFYKTQELDIQRGMKAEKVKFYSYSILGNWAKRRDLEKKLAGLDIEYQKQLKVLLEKRNKSKILRDIKERHFKEFRKDQINKEGSDLEELANKGNKSRYGL